MALRLRAPLACTMLGCRSELISPASSTSLLRLGLESDSTAVASLLSPPVRTYACVWMERGGTSMGACALGPHCAGAPTHGKMARAMGSLP